jgi:hypothetical protein
MEIDMNAYDPVMEEIYAARRKISERYNHDVWRIAQAAHERMLRDEATGRRKYVRLPVVRVKPAPAMARTAVSSIVR